MREFPEGEHSDQKELEMLNDEIIDEVSGKTRLVVPRRSRMIQRCGNVVIAN